MIYDRHDSGSGTENIYLIAPLLNGRGVPVLLAVPGPAGEQLVEVAAAAATVVDVVIVGYQGKVVIVRPPQAEPLVDVVKREEGKTARR